MYSGERNGTVNKLSAICSGGFLSEPPLPRCKVRESDTISPVFWVDISRLSKIILKTYPAGRMILNL